MNAIPASVRTTIRSALESLSIGVRMLEAKRRAQRLARFESYLDAGYLYPGASERRQIVADFSTVCLHTLLTPAGIANLEHVVASVEARGIPGAVVECGTWRGGAMSYMAHAHRRHASRPGDRSLWAFDSFVGFPDLTDEDEGEVTRLRLGAHSYAVSEEDVQKIILASGHPRARVRTVKGWFSDTVKPLVDEIGPIAVLRLDGDLYESTKTCLEALYPSVVSGGAVIVDDYGSYPGARKAWDEYARVHGIATALTYVDASVRFMWKA